MADVADGLLRMVEFPSNQAKVPFTASTVTLQTVVGERTALVLTPIVEITASKPPDPGGPGSIERWVIDAARNAVEEKLATVCIFRARADDGVGAYRFSRDLGSLTPTDLAEQMLAAQMFVYREMVQIGVCLFVHTEFGYTETEAFEGASRRLQASLGPRADDGDVEAEVDLWILQNLVFFFTVRFQGLTTSVLPDKLPLMERRMERIRRMAVRARVEKGAEVPAMEEHRGENRRDRRRRAEEALTDAPPLSTEAREGERPSKACRFQARCPIYPRFSLDSVLAIYKTFYCNSDFEKCKRYESANKGVVPDADLLPDGERMRPEPSQ